MATSTLANIKAVFTTAGTKQVIHKVTANGLTVEKVVEVVVKPDPTPVPVPPLVELYPPDVFFTVVTPLAMVMPAYRIPVEEKSYGILPENKVLRYTRVTDEVVFKKANPRHHYSKTQPWNCDETRALVSGHLLDVADNYRVIRTVGNLGTNFEWSKTDNDKVFSVNNNEIRVVKPSNNTSVLLFSGSANGWTRLSKGENEGTMDHLDRFIPIAGTKNGVYHIGYYNIAAGTMHTQPSTYFLPNGGSIDNCTIVSSGEWMSVRCTSVSNPQHGIYTIPGLAFVREIVLSTSSHADWGHHQDGGQVLVQHNGIGFRRIETGVFRSTITNWNKTFNNGFGMAGHSNARNYLRPGWMYNSNTKHESFRELYALKLDNGIDATCVANRFGFARIEKPLPIGVNSYDVETKGVASPTGRKMMFNTMWPGQDKIYAFVCDVVIRS